MVWGNREMMKTLNDLKINGIELDSIYNGDCITIMKYMKDKSVDLIVTDPPYGVSKKGKFEIPEKSYKRICEKWDVDVKDLTKNFIEQSHRVLKEGGAIYVTALFHNLRLCWDALEKNGFTFRNNFVFAIKNSMPIKFAKQIGCYAYSHNYALYFTKGKTKTFNYDYLKAINGGKQFRDFILITNRDRDSQYSKHPHPCEKPLPLFELFIKASSNEGDIILDMFGGSGTTGVACKKLGRNYILIDSNLEYCKMMVERIANVPEKLDRWIK